MKLIYVKSGIKKRDIVYRRNALLGNIGMALVQINTILNCPFITDDEIIEAKKVKAKLIDLNILFRKNKGSKIIVSKN